MGYSLFNDICRSSSPDASPSMPPGSLGTKLEHYETSYLEYLDSARIKVEDCVNACRCWCYPYDGDSPSAEILVQSSNSSTTDSVASTPVVTPAIEIKQLPGDSTPTAESTTPVAETVQELPAASSEQKTAEPEKQDSSNEVKESSSESTENSEPSKSTETSDGDNVDKLPVIRDTTKISHVKQDSCADSVISEADSALSGSSGNTETAHTEVEQAGSRSDSPLNDDFDAQDFNAFLLSLKRVKTPVEFCDNMEDSIQEFEELLNSLKLNISARTSTGESGRKTASQEEELPKFGSTVESKHVVKPSVANGADGGIEKIRPSSVVSLTEFDKEISKKNPALDNIQSSAGPSQPKPNPGTPTKYSVGAPNIGELTNNVDQCSSEANCSDSFTLRVD